MSALPDFDDRGFLPEGIFVASMEEVLVRFADSPSRRRRDAGATLRQVADHVANAGVPRIWVAGSFVSEKRSPKDVEIILDTAGMSAEQRAKLAPYAKENRVNLHKQFKVDLFERDPEDVKMRARIGAPSKPMLDWFQDVKPQQGGGRRGIVEVPLTASSAATQLEEGLNDDSE